MFHPVVDILNIVIQFGGKKFGRLKELSVNASFGHFLHEWMELLKKNNVKLRFESHFKINKRLKHILNGFITISIRLH